MKVKLINMANIVKISYVNATDKEILSNANYAEEGVLTYTETGLFLGLGNNKIIKYPKNDVEQFLNKEELVTLLKAKADNNSVYSKADIDIKLVDAVTRGFVDLSNYYNKQQLDIRFDDFLCKHDAVLKSDVYTKTEIDSKLIKDISTSLNNVYSKAELNNKLAAKVNSSSVYIKEEVDEKLREITSSKLDTAKLSDYYNKDQIDAALACKADIETTYNKVQVDDKLDDKANKDDVYDKVAMDDLLADKADAHHTFTKIETVDLIAGKANVDQVYTKLQLDDKLNLALLEKADREEIVNTYYTKNDVDEKIAALKQLVADIQAGGQVEINFDNYYTKAQADALFLSSTNVDKRIAESQSLIKADILNNVYSKEEANAKITAEIVKAQADAKPDLSTVYTKEEADNKFLTKEQGNGGYVSSALYASEKANLLATQTQVEEAKTELSQQLANNLKNVLTRKAHATGFFFNGGDELTKDNKLYFVKTAFMATDNFDNDKANLVEVLDNLAAVANKADKKALDNYYDKATVDQKLADAATGGTVDLAGYATKEELNNKADATALELKADKTALDNYYDKTAIDEKLKDITAGGNVDLSNYATKTELANKADTTALADLATKTELNNKADTTALEAKADKTALDNYYDKATVDQKLADAATGGTVDLAGYATKTELANKADTTALEAKADKTALADLATKTELNNKADTTALEAKADKTALDNLATKAELKTLATKEELNNKANTADVEGLIDTKINALNVTDKLDAAGVEAKIKEKIGDVANITGTIGTEVVDTENLVEVINLLITYTGTLKTEIDDLKNQLGQNA